MLWREKLSGLSWILHPNHALALRPEKHIPVLLLPPYNPHLASCECFVFPKLKNGLNGQRFGSVNNVQRATIQSLSAIPPEDFQGCFEEWSVVYLPKVHPLKETMFSCETFQSRIFSICLLYGHTSDVSSDLTDKIRWPCLTKVVYSNKLFKTFKLNNIKQYFSLYFKGR